MLGLHSFTIGAATSAALAGMVDSKIQALRRRQSVTFLQYIKLPRDRLVLMAQQLVAAALSIPILQLPSISSKAHKLHVIIMGHSPNIETRRSPLDCMPSTQFHLAPIPLPLSINSTKVLMPRCSSRLACSESSQTKCMHSSYTSCNHKPSCSND